MKNKIGRNDWCFCGSDKKYKKCCINVKVRKLDYDNCIEKSNQCIKSEEWLSDTLYPIVFGFELEKKVDKNILSKIKIIDRIKRNQNIPFEIRNEVNTLIKTQPFQSHMCHQNATQIALSIEGVEKVIGFYSEPLKNLMESNDLDLEYDAFNDVAKMWNTISGKSVYLKKCGNGIFKFNKNRNSFFDFINMRFYVKHSWNSYKGIHFDLTKNLDESYLANYFMEYFVYETQSLEDLNSNFEVSQSFLDLELLTPTKSTKILNQNFVGDLLVNKNYGVC